MSVNEAKNTSQKKIRFRATPKVFYRSDSRMDDMGRSEERSFKRARPSLFSFLKVELTRDYLLEHDEERYSAKREKVYSFMRIPREVERFMRYGFMQCADSFLFVYTFLPVRVMFALGTVLTRLFSKCFGLIYTRHKTVLTPAEICDLLKAVIIVVCSIIMCCLDTNMLYHLIKSQSVIKLYLFYNMLEVGDRLFSSFGQDIIDALFWTATEPRDRKREHLGVIPHLLFAVVYVVLHSTLVLFQATTLNVAINSNNKVLLTIMMSNNFVELKGSVFKKFDKNNLFQVTCSDVRERFHLSFQLFIVVLQTMKEYSWKIDRFWLLLPDCVIVLVVEMFVDWIKHAFITRFNELPLDVYRDYTTSLAYDLVQTRQKHAFTDHSDLVARRMGFIPLPLSVVMIRVLISSVSIDDAPSIILCLLAVVCLGALKVLNSILILGRACDLIAQHRLDRMSSFSPISNRANSPLPLNLTKALVVTSPLRALDAAQRGATMNGHGPLDCTGSRIQELDDVPPGDLGSAAIFANSTVDLKNATLNEELLRGEGEAIETVECSDITRSFPDITGEYSQEANAETEKAEGLKRAESEPSLTTCQNDQIENQK